MPRVIDGAGFGRADFVHHLRCHGGRRSAERTRLERLDGEGNRKLDSAAGRCSDFIGVPETHRGTPSYIKIVPPKRWFPMIVHSTSSRCARLGLPVVPDV